MMQATLKTYASLFKSLSALIVMTICGAILWQQISDIPQDDITTTIQAIAPSQWGVALLATWISFLAVGRYDAVWHRRLSTGTPAPHARRTGMTAIAIGQTIGAGTVVGAFVRWQLLPALGAKTTTAISIGVSLSFLGCWSILAVFAGAGLGLVPAIAVGGLGLVLGLTWATQPKLRNAFQRNAADAWHMLRLTSIDVGFAGFALWVLIPDASISLLAPIIAAYVIALGAGLISNAPGGLGAFDLSLMALLPAVGEADALAAILAFRVVYYLIPAIIAAANLITCHFRQTDAPAVPERSDAPISDLTRQGAQLMQVAGSIWTTQTHLLGKVALELSGNFAELQAFRANGLGFKALYKTNARLACIARQHGWAVRRIADDAVIQPDHWCPTGPHFRQLRRKIAQAEKAGVRINRAIGPLPFAALDRLAAEWATNHRGELGYAMGRYTHDYVAGQDIYLIWRGDYLCGFVTVQIRADRWAIDLIRYDDTTPCGAIQSALVTIIKAAKTRGARQLSLGAVPTAQTTCPIQTQIRGRKAGLAQFKQSFQPDWVPMYHAAPTRVQWMVSMMHVFWNIQRPGPRLLDWTLKTLTSLIIISPIFHLIRTRTHEIAAHLRARATLCKGGSHDPNIRKTSG